MRTPFPPAVQTLPLRVRAHFPVNYGGVFIQRAVRALDPVGLLAVLNRLPQPFAQGKE